MKTIGSIRGLLSVPSDLTKFILSSCPWMAEPWEAESIGYVFVLDDDDIHEVCTAPHLKESDYMTIDLESFDLWEVAGYFKERKWHPTQRIEENSDGSAVLSLTVNHLLELKRWILSWGNMAQVLEPQHFIEDIQRTIAEMQNIYKP